MLAALPDPMAPKPAFVTAPLAHRSRSSSTRCRHPTICPRWSRYQHSSALWRCTAGTSTPRVTVPTVSFVYYDGSSFVLEYDAPDRERPARLLVDPWLHDDLVFLNWPQFFRGVKQLAKKPISAFGEFDAILLSQHLPDHAHPPTLALLPRNLPVVAPTEALPLLNRLGYENIVALSPNESTIPFPEVLPDLTLTTGPGAVVGPPWSKPQLAFLWEFAASCSGGDSTAQESRDRPSPSAPLRIYLETHGEHDDNFLRKITADGRDALDAVIGPVCATTLPVLGNYRIVSGVPQLLHLCRATRPQACLAFDNTNTVSSGFLSKFIDQRGSYEELESALRADPATTNVDVRAPKIMESVVLATATAVPRSGESKVSGGNASHLSSSGQQQ